MLKHYFGVIQEGWRTIIIVLLVFCITSVLISLTATPIYRSTASFVIFPNENLTSSRDVVSSLDTLEKRTTISTYAEIINSDRIFSSAVSALKAEPALYQPYQQSVEVQPESNIFYLNVDGPDPRISAILANAIGEQGINLITSLYLIFDITILDEASLSTNPISPQPLRSLMIFGLAGLIAGMTLVVLGYQLQRPIEALRERINTDPESGAYKKAYFTNRLERWLSHNPESSLSLGIIELEDLKDVAETLPGVVLVDLLHNVTRIFKEQLRGNDIVGRWAEASFVIMLPSTPIKPAARTLVRLRDVLLEPVEDSSDQYQIQLKSSIGLTAREFEETLSELVRNVEIALEKANQSPRGIYIYPVELGQE